MRLWSVHPKYLDQKGLVALWREALLAQAVLAGQTKGYKHHPQLERFRAHENPMQAIGFYLLGVYEEACKRGYSFNFYKIGSHSGKVRPINVTSGQLGFEVSHLSRKVIERGQSFEFDNPMEIHHLFKVIDGQIETWEKL